MRDTNGRELQVGDRVVVCHTGHTNSTLLTGEVRSTTAKTALVSISNPGGKVDYANAIRIGQEKRVSAPHKIFCYEPALPPATMAQFEASRAVMQGLVESF